MLDYINDDSYNLSACGWVRYIEGKDPTTFHGRKDANGDFWPTVSYEIAVEGKVRWKRFKGPESASSESVTVGPDNPSVHVCFDTELFRKAIGSGRYGRLVLENGDSAIFELDDLLPLASARGGTGSYKQDVVEGRSSKIADGFAEVWLSAPANLVNVISVGPNLIGEFLYTVEQTEKTVLAESRTLDGDFWPKVTLRVAGRDKAWKTLGESHHSGIGTEIAIPPGKSESLRVSLDVFRPLLDTYCYGQIVFSNGQSSYFAIDDLNPDKSPEREMRSVEIKVP